MSLPPEIVEKLQAAGMRPSAIKTDAAEAWERGEIIPATADKWIADNKAKAHLWLNAEQLDLESSAFGESGKPNLTARSCLVREIGEEQAAERARDWGLTGLQDFKTNGKRPGGEQIKKAGRDNPWSAEGWNITRQGEVARADLALAQRLAKAAGSFLGATRPARLA